MQKCEHCKKFSGGCSWTAIDEDTDRVKFEPVKGWTAEESEVGYHIIDCPEFVSDGTERWVPGLPHSLKWDVEDFLFYVQSGMTDNEITRRMGGMPKSSISNYKTMLRKVGMLA